jgi:hypothetical protein
MRQKQSFEDYFYRNIHAEGCGCSEKIIENFEIDRQSTEFYQRRGNPFPAMLGALKRLFSRKRPT